MATAFVTVLVAVGLMAVAYAWLAIHRADNPDLNEIIDKETAIQEDIPPASMSAVSSKKTTGAFAEDNFDKEAEELIGLSKQLCSLGDLEGARYYLSKATAIEGLCEHQLKSIALIQSELTSEKY